MLNLNSLKLFYQKLDLVFIMTKSIMKSRYRKTWAGFLWVILNPILTFVVQALIFKNILKVNVENYYLFLLSGIVPWIFLTTTLTMSVSSFVVNRPILVAFKLDPWIFILSQAIDNLITFLFTFVVLLCANYQNVPFLFVKFPMFLLMTIIIFGFTFFFSFLLATINVFMRDTQFILQFVLNLAFYLTPIFYPKELIPEKYQWAIEYNPLYIVIRPFQNIFWKFNPHQFYSEMALAAGVFLVLTTVSVLYWRRKKYELYFRI